MSDKRSIICGRSHNQHIWKTIIPTLCLLIDNYIKDLISNRIFKIAFEFYLVLNYKTHKIIFWQFILIHCIKISPASSILSQYIVHACYQRLQLLICNRYYRQKLDAVIKFYPTKLYDENWLILPFSTDESLKRMNISFHVRELSSEIIQNDTA